MVNQERDSYEERMYICSRRELEKGNNTPLPQYPSRRTWRKMENSGVGHKKLLVARSDKESRKIYRWIRYLLMV